MEIEVKFSKTEIYDQIKTIGYMIAKADGIDENVMIADVAEQEQLIMLNQQFPKALTDVLRVFTPYRYKVTVEGEDTDDYTVIAQVPENFNTINIEKIEYSLTQFMVNRLLFDFFAVVKEDKAVYYGNIAGEERKNIKKMLGERVRN